MDSTDMLKGIFVVAQTPSLISSDNDYGRSKARTQ
ncbi:hypothetical protein T4D_8810 [Trichinella pseudospiralis]|uniref:Uncharacterized protein n=1 Tax=Trichinella pseudospiralis TaxID=6337 RepID=A0A0V1CCK9_TRIPS|nr:hypothetical protein T4D_8810 [Trichinella pseudospiralis]